jgi:CheY-like chemotaxis protein
MFSQAAARKAEQSYTTLSDKHRLLIVTDCSDRLRSLKASIHTDGIEIEITSAGSSEELSRACHSEHDLVVIDVGAARLPEVLRTLRSSERYSRISLLVEASRIINEPDLVGVLPRYRAMPCSRSDLLKLARRLMTGEVHPRTKRMLL